MTKMYISTLQVGQMIRKLADQINESKIKYDVVVGIANGGLNVSVPLAKILGLPHQSVHISYRHGDHPIVKNIDFIPNGNVLVVDDLVDKGGTIYTCYKQYHILPIVNRMDTAVLFCNLHTLHHIKYYVEPKPDCWIVFPWEDNNVDAR